MSVRDVIDRLDWPRIEAQLNEEGCAVLPGVLDDGLIAELLSARPDAVADLRKHFYERLVPTANHWNAVREIDHTFPDTLTEWMAQSGGGAGDATGGSARSRLTCLRIDDYEPLRQYGELPNAFPLQLVALLNEPGRDFSGGEFVLTEQRPRMQSRPMVLPLRRGDVAVLAVAHRPHKGTKGYYRVSLKHAISRVRSGERVGIELLIDEATVA